MSTAGLSRRRGAASSAVDDDGDTNSRNIERRGTSNGVPFHAGSAFEGGNKVAYDPRDLDRDAGEEEKIGGKAPRLTLMEEVLLLGIKDKQGYLSFWNDNISYALRGCILIELALRRRIAIARDTSRGYQLITDRLVEVLDDRQTGETILDETLKMMKAQEHDKLSINSWVDLLSGETWNVTKIGFQLKQVRERLAKGLVDKGVLRTEKRNFLLFDMATHPVADARAKQTLIDRVLTVLTATTAAVPPQALGDEGTQCRVLRSVCLVCAAASAGVVDNAMGRLDLEERELAMMRADELMAEFVCWPFGTEAREGRGRGPGPRRREAVGVDGGRASVLGFVDAARKEGMGEGDLGFELVAGVLEVLSKLDSLL